MTYFDTNPNTRWRVNEWYGKRCYHYDRFAEQLQIPQAYVPYIRFVNRQVRSEFFDVFHGVRFDFTRQYTHTYFSEDGWSIKWTVRIDENDRIVEVSPPSVSRITGQHDDPRPGSDHVISEHEYRPPNQDELADFANKLDELTIPRANLLLSKLREMELQIGKSRCAITDRGVENLSTANPDRLELPLQHLVELIEWSFTYLECFYNECFVRANVPGFDAEAHKSPLFLGSEWNSPTRAGIGVLSLINPRSYYDYPHLLEATLSRAMRNMSAANRNLIGFRIDEESSYEAGQRRRKKCSDAIESQFKGEIAISENRGESKKHLISY